MEEEIRLSTASNNHGKNDGNPNHGLNQHQARIVDENHSYFTYTAEIVSLRPLFQLVACIKPKENLDRCMRKMKGKMCVRKIERLSV